MILYGPRARASAIAKHRLIRQVNFEQKLIKIADKYAKKSDYWTEAANSGQPF